MLSIGIPVAATNVADMQMVLGFHDSSSIDSVMRNFMVDWIGFLTVVCLVELTWVEVTLHFVFCFREHFNFFVWIFCKSLIYHF